MAPVPADFRDALHQLGLPVLNEKPVPNGPTIPEDWKLPEGLPCDDEEEDEQ
jgi:hypothetical protein